MVEGARIPAPPKAKYDVKVPPKKKGGDTFEVKEKLFVLFIVIFVLEIILSQQMHR